MERKLESYWQDLKALGIEQDEYARMLSEARDVMADEAIRWEHLATIARDAQVTR